MTRYGLWVAMCVMLPGIVRAAAPCVVQLKAEGCTAADRIHIYDVAEIQGGDTDRVRQLRPLDLADFGERDRVNLTRAQVEVRLLLAGFGPDVVTVQGPGELSVRRLRKLELTDLSIEQQIQQQLCQQFQIASDDLQVRLVNAFIGTWLNQEGLQNPRVEVVPTPQLPLGRVTLTIRLLEGERVVAARGANVEIGRRQHVVVAAASMERSRVIVADHLREEVRFVDSLTDELTLEKVQGRKVALPLRPGEVVTLRHLAAETAAPGELVIRQGDAVRLTAKKGALTVVVPNAEALQSGRIGQAIRVKNTQSDRIITGRVVGRGEVEVLLQ